MGVLAPGETETIELPDGVNPAIHDTVIVSIKGAPTETVSLTPARAIIKNTSSAPTVYAVMVVPRWSVHAATLPWKDIASRITTFVKSIQAKRAPKLK